MAKSWTNDSIADLFKEVHENVADCCRFDF